ncbi:MAG TPA: hypothetical protein VGR28_13155 [Candidatus Thermoplasmatota archaeon]|jgi:hypothetical protein|nr:hypothetical protein [Candidatus Thermoplasmatota archaeon]
MRAPLAILVVASLALAGCLTNSAPAPLDGADPASLAPSAAPGLPAGVPAAFNTTGCEDHVGWLPLPMAMAQVPEGFSPVPFDPAGTLATVVFIGARCEATAGVGLAGEAMHAAFSGLAVDPPAELARADAGFQILLYGLVTDRDDLAAAFGAWGVDASKADAISLDTSDAGAARVGRYHSSAGGEVFDLATVIGQVATDGAGTSRWFSARDGKVVGMFDLDWNENNFGQGEAVLAWTGAMPGPPLAGVGIHSWGEAYGYEVRDVPLPEASTPAPSAAAAWPGFLRALPGSN